MQDIEDENPIMGPSRRAHATEDDGLVTEERSMVHSLSKSSPVMETAISTLAKVDDVDSGAEDSRSVPVDEYFDLIVKASLKLVSKEHSSEIRWHGLKLILHLLRFQWKEIGSIRLCHRLLILELSEKWAGSAMDLSLKSSAADFVAKIAWSDGISLLKILVPYLVSLSAEGASEAELVCLILRSILMGRNTSATHLKAGKGETVLHGLNEFLPQILPLLCSLLDKHARDSFIEQSNQHMELANQHEYTVIAVLDAALACMKWTPLCDMANLDIVRRCGSLLCSKKFSTHALQFLQSLWKRKKGVEYVVAVGLMFPILMNASENYLKHIEPELHYLKALWPSLRYPTVQVYMPKQLISFLNFWR